MKSIIIGLDMDIIPGKSIGGISLGDSIDDIIQCINAELSIEEYNISNSIGDYYFYKINSGAISFTCNKRGVVIALWCEPAYQGSYNNKLFPGITVAELKNRSKKQEIIKGYLVVDKNFNIYYGMPDDFDDFDHFYDLDDDITFNELYVGNLK